MLSAIPHGVRPVGEIARSERLPSDAAARVVIVAENWFETKSVCSSAERIVTFEFMAPHRRGRTAAAR
jgi:hypothetical protein